MRKFVVIGVMLAFLCSAHSQKTRFGQTPPPTLATVHLHISASHIRLNCSGSDTGIGPNFECGYGLYVDAVLNGKKVELWGDSKIREQQFALIAPGDYTAQLINDTHNADQTVVSQNYRLLLSGGMTWQCRLSGIVE